MLERLKTYNWEEAFKYAEPNVCEAGHQHTHPEAVITRGISTAPFKRGDVEEIIAIHECSTEGYGQWEGVAVFKLKDGRYANLRAGCDTSGWGWQEGGDSQVAASKEDIIRFGLSKEERQRLNLLLEEETPDEPSDYSAIGHADESGEPDENYASDEE